MGCDQERKKKETGNLVVDRNKINLEIRLKGGREGEELFLKMVRS